MKRGNFGKCVLILNIAGCIAAGSLFISNSIVVNGEEYEYDVLNRVVKVIYDDGGYVEYIYDSNGNIVKTIVHTVTSKDPEATGPSTKPGESEKPTESESSTKPGESEKPTESGSSTKPEKSGEPAESQASTETESSSELENEENPAGFGIIADSEKVGQAVESGTYTEGGAVESGHFTDSETSTESEASFQTTQTEEKGFFDWIFLLLRWIITISVGGIKWLIKVIL